MLSGRFVSAVYRTLYLHVMPGTTFISIPTSKNDVLIGNTFCCITYE